MHHILKYLQRLRLSRKRRLALYRRELPRYAVVCDRSPFWGGWNFFLARGIEESKQKCRQWIGSWYAERRPCGQAVVMSMEEFREFWKKNNSTCNTKSYD